MIQKMAQLAAQKRAYGIDLLKAIAILSVVIIHTCPYGYPVPSFDFFSSVFWGSLTRAAVPIFFLCSGALFLAPEKPFSAKKLFTKSIPRILAAMLAWGMAYKIFHLLGNGGRYLYPSYGTPLRSFSFLNRSSISTTCKSSCWSTSSCR